MNFAMIVAYNDEDVLKKSLLASIDLKNKKIEVVLQKGYSSASNAYNHGIEKTEAEIIIFVHQDVFLPIGWFDLLIEHVKNLERRDNNWGVLGIYGVKEDGEGKGYVYSTGLKRYVGSQFDEFKKVRILDELLLIIRRSSGLLFDKKLPGFHLYGTDICLEAEKRGMNNYVLPCFAIHNSNGVKYLPNDFWRAYSYLRNKWKKKLPIITPCIQIFWPTYIMMMNNLARRFFQLSILHRKVGSRVDDPAKLFLKLNSNHF